LWFRLRGVGALACAIAMGLTLASRAAAMPPVFVANEGLSSVSAFDVASNGTLASAGPPTPVSAQPRGLVVSPDGRCLYVALADNAVAAFAIGSGTELDPVAGSPFATGGEGGAGSLAMTSGGTYLFAASLAGSVSDFAVRQDCELQLTSAPTPIPVSAENTVASIVITVSEHFYAGTTDGNIYAFNIGSGAKAGELSKLPTSSYHAGGSLAGMALAPTSFPQGNPASTALFATGGDDVYAYEVDADGALTPWSGSPFPRSGGLLHGIAVGPPRNLFVVEQASFRNFLLRGLSTYSALMPETFSSCAGGGYARFGAVAANANELFLLTHYGIEPFSAPTQISTLHIDHGGCFSSEHAAALPTGSMPAAIALAPDPGPVASITIAAGPAGSPSKFDSSDSSDADGAVAEYAWRFGDGAGVEELGPEPTHVYAKPGTYPVTLSVTDDAGCSAEGLYNGLSALCLVDPRAEARGTVTVPPQPAPRVTGVHETHLRWREGPRLVEIRGAASRRRSARVGTVFSFDLNENASVHLNFEHLKAGHRSGRRCVTTVRRLSRSRGCMPIVSAGTLGFAAHAGTSSVAFQGRLSRSKRLRPGSYLLIISAANSFGLKSAPRQLAFTIVR
jgi:hypothetical protein